ncbi:hypothetical protein SUFP_068 [Sulfitobacter phage NYA-2014a]|uniref:hypothetical protein n=1 Tax=Sulfitobacter phage pCB2047-C TaxID=754043 RepID=UPI0002C058E0|nr:hypothetical protein SUBG_00033 [Sulfitobacter phage pCB2047-C]YP_007675440.1 hypothetical protein SUAG_00048 [Sulfitobacter phage pCB2047-A]YP_009146242.1 hypothetical protein SUFP_068 [Sulfitobacter phage NYA-2014a]PTA99617.1 hypothetical protein C8254_14430 [Sulfitobacter sp. CB-A]ULO21232.1 hypothetical protein IV89_001191 [Sulfitobacter sp. CB2047]AGG91203.1 hypothetical protein SUBG_00033 [Sulfitobacter phage pCB2047-C]AGH30774.1 hypothetical protein SUAG_00048 [Sulfitobacter phage p
MTTWTEAQIARHLHLWEHRHGPDSPEAGIVRQLRAERDAARVALIECRDEIDGYVRQEYPHDHPVQERYRQRDFAANPARIALAALPTTQETPHD